MLWVTRYLYLKMNDSSAADDTINNKAVDDYLRSRLGLLPDEVDWPANTRPSSAAPVGEETSSRTAASAWRVRDALTSLLGTHVSSVKSDSGLTVLEITSLMNEENESSLAIADITSSGSPMVTIESIVAPFLPPAVTPVTRDDEEGGGRGKLFINAEHVRKAFDAAAYAILRADIQGGGGKKNHPPPLVDGATNYSTSTVLSTTTTTPPTDGRPSMPPLIAAMESIRVARLTSLIEASAIPPGGIPSFLKKDNTIPWFHIPLLVNSNETAGAPPAVPAAASANGRVGGGVSSGNNDSGSGNNVVVHESFMMKRIKLEHDNNENSSNKQMHDPLLPPSTSPAATAAVPLTTSSSSVTTSTNNLQSAGGGGKRVKLSDEERNRKRRERDRRRREMERGIISSSSSSNNNDIAKNNSYGASATNICSTVMGTTNSTDKATNTQSSSEGGGETNLITATTTTMTTNVPITSLSSSGGNSGQKEEIPSSSSSSSAALPSNISINKSRKVGATIKTAVREPPTFNPNIISPVDDVAAVSLAGISDANPAVSRALLCAVAAGVFQEYSSTSSTSLLLSAAATNNDGEDAKKNNNTSSTSSNIIAAAASAATTTTDNNVVVKMNDILIARATRLTNRILNLTHGMTRRGDQRREFRIDTLLSKISIDIGGGKLSVLTIPSGHSLPLLAPNPFMSTYNDNTMDDSTSGGGSSVLSVFTKSLLAADHDNEWKHSCLPRLLDVLSKGAGHAILYDMNWTDRAIRVSDLLRNMITVTTSSRSTSTSNHRSYTNYGPHLIVTSSGGEDFEKFVGVFGQLGSGLHRSTFMKKVNGNNDSSTSSSSDDNNVSPLRVLPYHGSKAHRRQLRKHFGSLMPSSESHFAFCAGIQDSPFHVVLTTYSELMEDFAHFCQIPFQAVVLDDGMSFIGCAHSDPIGKLGMMWNSGFWNKSGTVSSSTSWDFSKDVGVEASDESPRKCIISSPGGERTGGTSGKHHTIGLTARHHILLASRMHAQYRGQIHKAPILGLLSFLSPQFADTIRDDWEKCRAAGCTHSMSYIQTLLARLVIVYAGDAVNRSIIDSTALSLKAITGELVSRQSMPSYSVTDEDEGLDKLISSKKISQSNKIAVAWFPVFSTIRKEIGQVSLDLILTGIKRVSATAFVCEEICTASSTTVTGGGGGVAGLSTYRPAVRCGRCFSSESGLKQHVMSSHAPRGTWLCRISGVDCGTSQARAQHERALRAPRRVSSTSPVKGDALVVGGDGVSQPSRGRKRRPEFSSPSEDQYASGGQIPTDPNIVTPDLSVIDIKKLPPHIKPLLRDPNFTSRTGGNSKRYVYAYRGVCRQQRKGHDRWQSQISYNGQNHYLGTFDSEWDAAAVYSWAHLLLYGEEATRKAQLEGEEAAAAFAQHERDVAEGKIPPPTPAIPKKKKREVRPKVQIDIAKSDTMKVESLSTGQQNVNSQTEMTPGGERNSIVSVFNTRTSSESGVIDLSKMKSQIATMLSSGTKGTSKASILSTRKDLADLNEKQLLQNVSSYMTSASGATTVNVLRTSISKAYLQTSMCPPPTTTTHSNNTTLNQSTSQDTTSTTSTNRPYKNAMIIGLKASDFNWQMKTFIESCGVGGSMSLSVTIANLHSQFGNNGVNGTFYALIRSSTFTLGRASNDDCTMNKYLPPSCNISLGTPVGNLDCNIGGPENSCSTMAAKILFVPSSVNGNYQFIACNNDDVITLNGQRVCMATGPLPLRDKDVCSVGARVFVFIEEISFD